MSFVSRRVAWLYQGLAAAGLLFGGISPVIGVASDVVDPSWQELRLNARRTGCSRAQVSTLRERLLKIGVWIEVSVRRIVLHLPASSPFKHDWGRVAVALGARAG